VTAADTDLVVIVGWKPRDKYLNLLQAAGDTATDARPRTASHASKQLAGKRGHRALLPRDLAVDHQPR
jgi:hypothetical protein